LELSGCQFFHLFAAQFLTNLSQYIIVEGKPLVAKIFLFSLRFINQRSPSQMFFKSATFAEVNEAEIL